MIPVTPMAVLSWERTCVWFSLLCVHVCAFRPALCRGNPARLHYGYDFNGNVCGESAVNKDKKYLYYPYPFPPVDPKTGGFGATDQVDLTWSPSPPPCTYPCAPRNITTLDISSPVEILQTARLPSFVHSSPRCAPSFRPSSLISSILLR